MLDEQQEATDDAVDVADAGGDDGGAVDLADLGADVETADEPAVSPEELMDIPDAPEMPGRTPDELTHMHADASELGAQAAAEDAAAEDAPADDPPAEDAPAEDAPAEDA